MSLLPKRRWLCCRSYRTGLVVLAGAIAFITAFAVCFRAHLFWQYTANRLDLEDVKAIPNQRMPVLATPEDWLRCRINSIEFSLPPELAATMTSIRDVFTFQHDTRMLIVARPTGLSEFSELLHTASKLSPDSQPFTMPRLRLACSLASSDDFRWSMTANEVNWHTFCVTTSNMVRLMSKGRTESLFRDDIEGLVFFDDERAVFDWQSTDQIYGGYMHFKDSSGKIDPAWIRAVCQSLKVTSSNSTGQ